jgi:hypothetical protein
MMENKCNPLYVSDRMWFDMLDPLSNAVCRYTRGALMQSIVMDAMTSSITNTSIVPGSTLHNIIEELNNE